MYRTDLYRSDLYRTDLRAMDVAEAAGTEVLPGRRAKAVAPSWWESLRPRLLVGAAWLVLVLFTYVLLSFHNPLQPAFTATEAALALVLLGLVISRA
jgi:hypothetical protein